MISNKDHETNVDFERKIQTDITPVTQKQPKRQRTTNTFEINRQYRELIPVWEQLTTDQFDPWYVVPRQEFTPYFRRLISTAVVVVSRVGCLGVADVVKGEYDK